MELDEANQYKKFIEEIASLLLEGESTPDGEEMEWENDDAWAALQGIIISARDLLSGT